MSTKLTLKLDEKAIDAAKRYACQHHTSLSSLVEGYFKSLTEGKKKHYKAEALAGCLEGLNKLSDADIKDMYLKDKHNV